MVSLFFIGTEVVFAQSGTLHSFRLYNDPSFNSYFVDMFPKSRTPYLHIGSQGSQGLLLKIDNKLRKYKENKELSIIEDHFILYKRYDDTDMLYPIIISFEDYKVLALKQKFENSFYREVVKKMKQKRGSSSYGSKSLTLLSRDIGGTNLALNIDGNISISGQLIFENKDLVNLNSNDSKSWDLDINQTQKFNVEGKIGEKLKVNVRQDSEADFDWQNNMIITYEGDKNEIIQEVEAGNISLNLPSTQFVNVGSGKSEGLFGIKMINRFGPLELQGIISRQEVKKASKSFSPGQSAEGTYISDYSYIRDRYFFIDNKFKQEFYPLTEDLQHTYDPEYVIYRFDVFKRVTNIESGIIPGTAYLDPFDENSYKEQGSWVRLEENIDYEIDQILGYIRFKTLSSQDVVSLSYSVGRFDGQNIIPHDENHPDSTNTDFYDDYFLNLANNPDFIPRMKLIKAQGQSTPTSPTWPLMLKNVYSLGGSNIQLDELEVEVVYVGGTLEEETHSQINNNYSFLNLFGLDTKDQNGNNIASGDGIIDYQYPNIVKSQYGELFFPTYLPFAYEPTEGDMEVQWGTNIEDIGEVLNTVLDDSDNNFSDESDSGPAMYYSTNNQDVLGEHEFVIKVKHSESLRSSTINLGFMIVEGSEVIRLNGSNLINGTDYTIDYFTGTLNIINQNALDPTANLDITYEENELLSFDQKLLTGLHFKYDYSDNDYFSGGMYYYNQSIIDDRVDFGFEPMRNFIWNISGKYDQDIPLLTDLVNSIPLIDRKKNSSLFLEGEYAQVYPNPNPLGQAFLDDFESSKRVSSPSIMQRHWKKSSPPVMNGDTLSVYDRGYTNWYNPFIDINTQDIWPQQEVSNQANNSTTKTLFIQTDHYNESMWNGITTQLYSSDFDQSQSKYLDIWINSDYVNDDNLLLHIDIGAISEDMNNNGNLDTEDEDIYGPGLGDGILDDSEDIGLDGCLDDYETGWGGCLDSSATTEDGSPITFSYYCSLENPPLDIINFDLCLNDDAVNDPNNDNWSYEQYSNDYSDINGTQGNGLSTDYRYPDSEDLDNDQSLDIINNYFTYTLDISDISNLESQTYNDNGDPTGWKLYRILLSNFEQESTSPDISISWNDVRAMRLWTSYDPLLESDGIDFSGSNLLKIAKIEIVGNEWQELGSTSIDQISSDLFQPDSSFAITVVNTQDNSEYEEPPGVVGEYDAYNDIRLKEQSLVLDFQPITTDLGGIQSDQVIAIKKVLTNLTNDNKNNFFAYNFMEMFVYGNPIDTLGSDSWFEGDSSKVDLLFRIGKDDDFYELRQPIFSEWDSKNHIKINIDELTRYKLNINSLDEFEDTGLDGVFTESENGCFDVDTLAYGGYLPEGVTYSELYVEALEQEGESFYEYLSEDNDARICGPIHWDFFGPGSSSNCNTCSIDDPNGDNYQSVELGGYNMIKDYSQDSLSFGLEGDGKWQNSEPLTDYNGNNIFDYPANYDSNQGIWYWDNQQEDISSVCYNCSEFIIKGEPAINRIEYIIVGAVNNSNNIVYGKFFLDELRLTGVKKDEGAAFRFKGSLDFSDLLSINTEFKKEDADFHRLEERLGTGDTEEYFSFQTGFNPDMFLPTKWGVKIPFKVNFTSLVKTPKYYPNQPDVVTQTNLNSFVPDSIKTISETASFSTSFSKTTKSDNWFIRSTFDKLSLNYSMIQKNNSSVNIEKNIINNADLALNYSYSFGRDNYISPFKKLDKIPFIGNAVSKTKIYYSPEKFSTSMNVSESEENTLMRTGTNTDTYDLGLNRSYILNYKITDNMKSNYKKTINSDLDFYMEKNGYSKSDLFSDLSPGLIQSVSEDLSNTFSPDILPWLNPSIKYNPYYTWNISNQADSIPSATIESKTYVESSFNFGPKEFIGVFYKPDSAKKKKTSSRRRGRKQTQSNTQEPLLKIKNESVKKIFDEVYDYASKISKITIKYTYNARHRHSNIRSDQFIDYNYRLGLIWTPENLQFNDLNEQISSYLHDFDRELRINVPTITVIPKLSLTSIEFKNKTSRTLESASSPDSSRVVSYLPLGIKGDKGIPMISWGLTWTGLESNKFITKYFKTFKLTHNYKGEMTESFINSELQRRDYKLDFSPLIKLDARSKGKDPVRFELGMKYSVDIKNEGTTTERSYINEINSTLEFSRSDGINVPFFGELSNNISFSLSTDWEMTYTLLSTQLVDNLDDFNLQSRKTTLSFRPNISYNFSKYVNGTVFYKYILEDDLITGKDKINDFGFTVNIKIQG